MAPVGLFPSIVSHSVCGATVRMGTEPSYRAKGTPFGPLESL